MLTAFVVGCGGAGLPVPAVSVADLPGRDLDGPGPSDAALKSSLCESDVGRLHAVHSGDPERLAVLFIHGTPGRWRAFERYLTDPELTERFHLVAIDRLGWGASRLADAPDRVASAFSVHSAAIAPLVESLDRRNGGAGVIVVGHSLGASLAPRLAVDLAPAIRGLVLLSGSHDPELRARRWYNLLADLAPVRWLVPEDLRRSNDEIMALPRELEINDDLWPELEVPVVVIQGMDDPLVSPGHAGFVEARLRSADVRILRLENTNHFIPWNRYELIRTELLDLADRISGAPYPATASAERSITRASDQDACVAAAGH